MYGRRYAGFSAGEKKLVQRGKFENREKIEKIDFSEKVGNGLQWPKSVPGTVVGPFGPPGAISDLF